jgi:hypothetical protein
MRNRRPPPLSAFHLSSLFHRYQRLHRSRLSPCLFSFVRAVILTFDQVYWLPIVGFFDSYQFSSFSDSVPITLFYKFGFLLGQSCALPSATVTPQSAFFGKSPRTIPPFPSMTLRGSYSPIRRRRILSLGSAQFELQFRINRTIWRGYGAASEPQMGQVCLTWCRNLAFTVREEPMPPRRTGNSGHLALDTLRK